MRVRGNVCAAVKEKGKEYIEIWIADGAMPSACININKHTCMFMGREGEREQELGWHTDSCLR